MQYTGSATNIIETTQMQSIVLLLPQMPPHALKL